jgi:hypothetical protein
MAGITTERAMSEMTLENLRLHRISTVLERRIAPLAVYLINISNNGMIAEYRVRIWKFRVYIRVLNLQIKSKLKGFSSEARTFLEKSVSTHKFVANV